MFAIGDKIVYPMHGAGIIEQIEQTKILGEINEYYVLRVPCGDMKIMIPVKSSDDIGIRAVAPLSQLAAVYTLLGEESNEMPGNWNRRYRENMDKLKSGEIEQVAEVVRNLIRIDRQKKLSTGEKKMLSNAKQILTSEMILVGNMSNEEAEAIIDSKV